MPENGSRHEALARELARHLNTGGGGGTTTTTSGGTTAATSVSINDPDSGVTLNLDANGNITIANQILDSATFTNSFGNQTDAAAATDTASASFMSLFKRLVTRVSSIITLLPTTLLDGAFRVAYNYAAQATAIIDADSSSAAAVTSVAASVASVPILAASAARKPGSSVFNHSSSDMYLRLGTTDASTTAFTVLIAAGGYYELPKRWKGAIRGIWTTADGAARVTELS